MTFNLGGFSQVPARLGEDTDQAKAPNATGVSRDIPVWLGEGLNQAEEAISTMVLDQVPPQLGEERDNSEGPSTIGVPKHFPPRLGEGTDKAEEAIYSMVLPSRSPARWGRGHIRGPQCHQGPWVCSTQCMRGRGTSEHAIATEAPILGSPRLMNQDHF